VDAKYFFYQVIIADVYLSGGKAPLSGTEERTARAISAYAQCAFIWRVLYMHAKS
jgi:hypothetical protein